MTSNPAPAPLPLVVPDASVAAKWYFDDEDDTAQARTLLERFQRQTAVALAPDCFFYELASLIRRAERRQPRRLEAAQADRIFAGIVALPVPSVESRPYLRRHCGAAGSERGEPPVPP